jgi:hypothetical protein
MDTQKKTNKKDYRIYTLFSLLSLIFSNYLIIILLYSEFEIPFVSERSLLIWINSLFWLIITILFFKKIITSEKVNKILFSLSFFMIVFILSVFADRIVGLFIKENIKPEKTHRGIIFEPNTTASYATTEFNYVAKINSLGIRDQEIDIKIVNDLVEIQDRLFTIESMLACDTSPAKLNIPEDNL